jgi:hypothetical protein
MCFGLSYHGTSVELYRRGKKPQTYKVAHTARCYTLGLHQKQEYWKLTGHRFVRSDVPLPCVNVCHHISTGVYLQTVTPKISVRYVLFFVGGKGANIAIFNLRFEPGGLAA